MPALQRELGDSATQPSGATEDKNLHGLSMA
jgi:hypothetical protein